MISAVSSSSSSGYSSVFQHSADCACPRCCGLRDDDKKTDTPANTGPRKQNGEPLSADEQKEVSKLQARDQEVRRHEAAHQAAGGGLAGAATFSYQQGPDGRQYAIGGEVSIQIRHGGTPQETIANAERVRAAALAPDEPSGQDRAVAASAAARAQQARVELLQQKNGGKPLQPLKAFQQANAPDSKTGAAVDTYA